MEDPTNILAVLASAVFAVVLGGLWYGPVFGKMWMNLTGMTPEKMKAMPLSAPVAMLGGFITAFLMAYVLAHGIIFGNAFTHMSGIEGGMTGAFWYWLGFAVPLTGGAFLWEGKSFKLWVLNAGYYLVSLLGMGAILGAWS